MSWSVRNLLTPFTNLKNNLSDGYQFGDWFGSALGFRRNEEMLAGTAGDGDALTKIGNLISGETDFARNMDLTAQENVMNRENMEIQNAFTAQREDLAYARNRQDALEARAWEENMSNTAITRQMADLKNAGLNPYLAAGGAGASTPTAQLPGANSASSASIPGVSLPVSKIWANTSDTFKTTASNLLSLAMISKFIKM